VPHEESPTHDSPDPLALQEASAYEQIEEDRWLEEPEELPRRPRRRLLSPVPLALLAVLLTACGFIGGVLVEKGQASSSSSSAATGGGASSFAALRAAAGGGTRAGSSGREAAGSTGSAGAITRPTTGQVAYLAGDTLYVTNAEGNTIKVTTSAGTSVTKSVKATVKGIHPGETVTITGASAADGSLAAESISVGSGGSGLAALFGGSTRSGSSAGAASGGSGAGPSLFGSG
jgi:hypothetical protein